MADDSSASPSMERVPRTITLEDGQVLTLAQLTALLEAQGSSNPIEEAGVRFGIGDLVEVGPDGVARYKLSGLVV